MISIILIRQIWEGWLYILSFRLWEGPFFFLDLIDDVFWMLPFSSARQATKVWQDFSITDDVWNARRKVIRAEHRLSTARTEPETYWKERLISKSCAASDAFAAVVEAVQDGKLQYEERSD